MSVNQYLIRVEARVMVEYVIESEDEFSTPEQAFADGEMVDQIDIETVDHDWKTATLERCE